MEKRHMAAALLLPLVLVAPIRAQGPAEVRSENRVIAGPSYVLPDDSRSPRLPLRGGARGIGVEVSPIIQQDGSTVYRRSLIGSWPLARDVSLGVGLIEVTRTSRKERALSRTRPMSDTEGRRDRIAAIGLSFSF